MEFEFPWILLLFAVAIPLFVVLRRSDLLTREVLRRLKSKPASHRHFVSKYVLALVFTASLVVVAAQPYMEPRSTGDYLFIVDSSRSMEARHSCGEPTFLDRSKDVVRDLLDGVPEGRFGIVAFDRLAFPITQLTYDHSYLDEVLRNGLFIGMSYRATGTDLGNALSVVAQKKQKLPDLYGNLRYVILLSDGHMDSEEWQKELEQPFEDLQLANMRVIAVGIGNQIETPIPITSQGRECRKEFIEVEGQTVRIPFRPDILKLIASETRGEYFDEGQTDELITFIREETLTGVPEGAEFNEQQRHSIAWIFLIPATIALFGFLFL